jgi:predicted metal-dependent enzyme (double-stranded beta helix superfamily)
VGAQDLIDAKCGAVMYGLEPDRSVILMRRECLKLSLGAFAALLTGCVHRSSLFRQAPLTWEEFVNDLAVRAEDVFARRINEETYASSLVKCLRRMDPTLVPPLRELPVRKRFTVSEFVLPSGLGFHHHDHRQYNGVIFVLDGQVRIRSFDIIGTDRTPPPGKEVLISETRSSTFGVSEFSTLTTTRDNIHDVRATIGGCRLLDIFTWMGPAPQSVFLEVQDIPVDANRRVHRATFRS